MDNTNNIITLTDSYKFSHFKMYENVTGISSYFESRHGAKFPTTVFFGLQYIIKKYLEGRVVTREKIDHAKRLSKAHLGCESAMNIDMWEIILRDHGGQLPIKIRAFPEGSEVNTSNALVIVEDTDSRCFPLVNHLETLLTNVWSASTVATLSRYIKKDMIKWAELTCDDLNHIDFQLHDFSARSVKCPEAAGFCGMGHLLNFFGTDTVAAIEYALQYYNADIETVGKSVFATEHNTMMYKGREGEVDLVGKALELNPEGIFSVVADTYDIYNFVTNIVGKRYKNQILNRNGVFVVRPDSVTPNHNTKEDMTVWIVKELYNIFGGKVNNKGYKELNPRLKALYGDSITIDDANKIFNLLEKHGFAANNVVLGCGKFLSDEPNRDWQRFAYKTSAVKINGSWEGISKNPLGSNKMSKKGLLKVTKNEYGYRTLTQYDEGFDDAKCELETVFENGKLIREQTFDQVKNRLTKQP